MIKPTAGRDYPGSVGELLAWFTSDADCRDYLEWLRWPDGFLCSECGHVEYLREWEPPDIAVQSHWYCEREPAARGLGSHWISPGHQASRCAALARML